MAIELSSLDSERYIANPTAYARMAVDKPQHHFSPSICFSPGLPILYREPAMQDVIRDTTLWIVVLDHFISCRCHH